MSFKRVLYSSVSIMVIAGTSALVGALTGGAITLEVMRGNDKIQIQVTLGEARHD